MLEVETREAARSQTMKGCRCHAEELGLYSEDSGATEGFLAGERDDEIFVG